MKIQFTVTKEQLLEGLGDVERVTLKRLELEDSYRFSGEPFVVRMSMMDEEMGKNFDKYPEVSKTLSPVEFRMFCKMLKGACGAEDLITCTRNASPSENAVAVHIKNMRVKFEVHKLPWKVVTARKRMEYHGCYSLEKVK